MDLSFYIIKIGKTVIFNLIKFLKKEHFLQVHDKVFCGGCCEVDLFLKG